MNMQVTLQASKSIAYRVGWAEISGARRDGSPEVEFMTVEREPGDYFNAPAEVTARLIADGRAVRARPTGKLADLLTAVLPEETPLAAVLAGLTVRGVRPWHAVQKDGHWRPAAVSHGPARGGFSARFSNAAEAEAVWTADPSATALFSYLTEHGFVRAYIWKAGGLREIATEIHSIGR